MEKTGPVWYSFTYNGSEYKTTLGISLNNLGADIYVSKGADSDPNDFSHDMSFKNVTSLNITMNDSEGYSVAMYIPAIDIKSNTLLDSSVNVKFEELKGIA